MDWRPEPPAPRQRLSREERKRQTRERLLAAAQALFAAKGMEASTVDEIAGAAGFTRGAFYAHFENKEHVMRELITTGFDGDTKAIETFTDPEISGDPAGIYQTYSSRFTENPESLMWALEFQMAALRHPELRDAYNRQRRAIRDRVMETVLAVIGPEAAPDDLRLRSIAEALVTLQIGLSARRLVDAEEVPEEAFRHIFEVLLKGMDAQG